jgi:hypothetical protein
MLQRERWPLLTVKHDDKAAWTNDEVLCRRLSSAPIISLTNLPGRRAMSWINERTVNDTERRAEQYSVRLTFWKGNQLGAITESWQRRDVLQ